MPQPADQLRRVDVGDTTLPLATDGTGEGPPVLLLHGAAADLRLWDRHRAILADRHPMALTLRYHGSDPWDDAWPPYGVRTHAEDLIAVLEQIGPSHLVAWSYSGHVVFDVALRRPDLVRSALVHEPGVPTYVTDGEALAAWRADAEAVFAPVRAALGREDERAALEAMMDGSGEQIGYAATQPAASWQVQLDNARTLPLLFLRQDPPPRITAEDLGGLQVPVRVTRGERTRPLYAVPAAAAQAAIGGGEHPVIPGAGHMWPDEDPAAFSEAVRAHLDDVG